MLPDIMDDNNKNTHKDAEEISIKDIFTNVIAGIKYLARKWVLILALGILCGLLGLAYSIFVSPIYTATCTFVLDDSKSVSPMGQYAGLASLAGVSLNNGGGIFQGDNIIELYKSRTMIEKALLQEVNIVGKNQLLIDRYINYNQLRAKWKEKDDIASISFTGDPEKFNRKQDSIITNIVELFNKKYLGVTKPDKKLSIIEVDVSSKDEMFAKEFTNMLVKTVNDFYIRTTTKKTSQNVAVLQRQADSVKMVLNSSISGVASSVDAAPNANPLLLSLKVPSQRKQVDVQASTAIYSAIVQNLEIAKISLRQSIPLIQVIDQPVLPLDNNRPGKITSAFLGTIAGIFLTIVYLLVTKMFRRLFA